MTHTHSISDPVRRDDAPPADQGGARRRRHRRTQVVIGLGLAILAGGSVVAIDLSLERHDRSTVTFTDPVSSVRVDVSGSVRLVGTADRTVTVERRVERGIRGPSHHEWVDDGELVISSSCPLRVLAPSCEVDYLVHVPSEVSVELDGGGLTADVVGIDGALDVSINGGDVDATFDEAPTAIKARTNGGDIDIVIPDDGLAYRVDASSDGGSTEVDVRTDPTSDRILDLHTNGGSISVTYTATP
jgi:hypothetical protein